MSDNVSPKCGQPSCTCCAQLTTNAEIGKWVFVEYIQLVDPEIARLRAALAEKEKTLNIFRGLIYDQAELITTAEKERDDARKWANKLQNKMFSILVALYESQGASYYAVAELCDEVLDRSGALLGRVREEARKRRAANV